MSLINNARITTQLIAATLVLAMTSASFPGRTLGQAPDLTKGLERSTSKPRITNSIGMTMATIEPKPIGFLMGAPKYRIEIIVDGKGFKTSPVFIVSDTAGKYQRFEFVDTETKATPRFYIPVPFKSGEITKTPSSEAEIAANIAAAVNADQNIDVVVNVQGSVLNFNNIGFFGKGQLNTGGTNHITIKSDPYASDDERPQHLVKLEKTFSIGVTEVTQAQWKTVMGNNPSSPISDHYPVNNISYEDAVAFCAKLSALKAESDAGRTYRLPTEAEWEYACRSENPESYYFSDDPETLKLHAHFNRERVANVSSIQNDTLLITLEEEKDGVADGAISLEEFIKKGLPRPKINEQISVIIEDDDEDNKRFICKPAPPHEIKTVASNRPNPWGLYDVYGNVAEWCQDVYQANYYGDNSPIKDPEGPATGSIRVLRGGSYMSQASSCRSSYRGSADQQIRSRQNGLRIVCIQK